MLNYRMMDETCLLCRCLHDGPIPVQETRSPDTRSLDAEVNANVPRGTINAFLTAVCQVYGSCALLAIDDDNVIGKIRFYPQQLLDILIDSEPCLHTPASVRTIYSLDLKSLPQKESLRDKTLYIYCYQLVNDYKAVAEGRRPEQPSYLGRGIATSMLTKLIDWACAEGWDQIRAQASPHIPPLMMWSCNFSVERYKRLGFQATPSPTDRQEGALHQRRGYHGEAMKKVWEPYANLSDEEVTTVYDVVLDLKTGAESS